MTTNRLDRRAVLKATGATLLAGALAGCTGGNADSGGGGSGGSGGDDEPFDYVSDANGYDGSPTDATGKSAVTVDVGSNNGYAFGPAALKISPGTTVTWKWTGQGGSHNVVAEDGSFESSYSAEAGYTFEHTFESVGVYDYYCAPHESMGMKGVVQVVE
ncbi:halocyanin domain-containing protein [Halospeciosus flavus]|uniref:Halocyanin domain-containing protein n=1 Tax=Halospeciosus flavus TaxID=3032283 RepID=A0ABD5Z5G4_9EURY|nr:halocyanin domain-containing protein [Halospeciosus flavus]